MGIFARIFQDLAQPGTQGDTVVKDAIFPKAHRTAASLRKTRAIGRTKGDLNAKLHMLRDGKGRPLDFFVSPGQLADSRGALAMVDDIPTDGVAGDGSRALVRAELVSRAAQQAG